MHFCTECENMYYTRLGGNDQNTLIYYCRKCGHEDDSLSALADNICVSKTHIKTSAASFRHMVNEFTPLDPTLPRVTNIPCPNTACPSRQVGEGEELRENNIIYLRYDDSNLKYVYICSNCQTVWKSANN
jgi:DNA-directed RNA polymerase subunit M/transcription elongation factor TFIIS